MNDQELIDRARVDPTAFGELYERYFGRIYGYVYQRIGSAIEAEDLTSSVFFQALKSLPRYVDQGLPFSAWLYRIAHNLVINWHRDRSRRPIVPLGSDEEVPVEVPAIEQRDDQDLVQWAISKLSAERQHLLLLKFFEDMTNADIGRVMGRTEGAVKALLHRTLASLREQIEALELPELSGGFDFGQQPTQQSLGGK